MGTISSPGGTGSKANLAACDDQMRDARAGIGSAALRLDLRSHSLHVVQHAQEVSAPEHADLLLGMAAPDQLQGDVEGLRGVDRCGLRRRVRIW